MNIGSLLLLTTWIAILFLGSAYIIFRKILPKYKTLIADTSFEDIIMTLNLTINTEFDLWEQDVFIDNEGVANNAQYENFYNEICVNILNSLPEAYFDAACHYIKREAIVTLVARQTKNFLNKHVQEAFPDPTVKMLFNEDYPEENE